MRDPRESFDFQDTSRVRALIGVAVAMMVWGLFAPLIQLRSANGALASAGSIVLSYSTVDKLCGLVLAAVAAGSLISASTDHYAYLGKLAYSAFLTTVGLFLWHGLSYLFIGRFSLGLYVPAWLSWWPHLAFGYAWILLIGSAGLLCFAAFLAGQAPELASLHGRVGSAVAATKTAALQNKAPRWESADYVPPSPHAEAFWKAMAAFLIFSFCAGLPVLGFFLWQFLDEQDSPHSGLALTGTILGALYFGGMILMQLLHFAGLVGR